MDIKREMIDEQNDNYQCTKATTVKREEDR